MPRQIIFDAEARLEFDDAVIWYDEEHPGLGDRFESHVHATFQNILKGPERFKLVSRTIRQAWVEVFDKYSVCFRTEPNFIGTVSIFHGARNPDELKRRLR